MRLSIISSLVVVFVGVGLARAIGLSEYPTVAIGFVPALLIAFPAVKTFMGTSLTFKVWAIIVAIGAFSTWLIYLALGR